MGAGLGGLGAAISILLAGHKVIVLEAAQELGEVIQEFRVPHVMEHKLMNPDRSWYPNSA